jgi:hypothetical protein
MSRNKVVLMIYVVGVLLGGAGMAIYATPGVERFSLYLFLIVFTLYVVIMRIEKRGV